MPVDDDPPWDSEAGEPSWYDVDDQPSWDSDDDGLPPHLDDSTVFVGAPVGDTAAVGDTAPVGDGVTARHGRDEGGDREPGGGSGRPSGIFGLAAGALSDATRFVTGAIAGGRPQDHPELTRVLDTVVGIGNGVTTVAGTVAGTAGRLAKPVVDLALHPPLVPQRWQPGTVLEQFETAGRSSRELGEQDVVSLAGELIPAILQAVLDRIDLTQLVLDRVDLGRIVDAVDLDAAVERVDIGRIIDRVDIDAVLARVDIDGVVATVDLNRIIDRVDIDAILAKVDIDGVVATVNLDKIIGRVDVNAVAATIDVDAIIDRIDLGGIAEEVIDEIDLPRIIRESTGSIASETMVGVRLTSASADDQVRRIMEKLRLRHRGGPEDDPTMLAVSVAPLPARRRLLRGTAPTAPPARTDPGVDVDPDPGVDPAGQPTSTMSGPPRPSTEAGQQ